MGQLAVGGQTYPLNGAASVTLSASGGGTCFVAPSGSESWHVNRAAVVTNQGTSSPPFPVCAIYVDSAADANVLDKTYSGHLDATDLDLHLEKGQRLVAVWTGGTAGTVATLSVFGTRRLY